MPEHLTSDQIQQYCDRQLPPTELLTASEHLAECGECQRRVEREADGDRAFFAMRSAGLDETAALRFEDHPSHEQIAGYVDGTATGDAQRFVDDHLAHCVQCAMSVDELRAFKEDLPSLAHREGFWKRRTTSSSSTSFLRRPVFAFGLPLAFASLVIAGLLLWPGPDQRVLSPVAGPPTPSVPVPVVAQLNDGGATLMLDAQGKLSGAGELPSPYQQLIRDTLSGRQLAKPPSLSGLTRPGSALMGGDDAGNRFSLTDPVGKVTLTDRPIFRWSQLKGASGYIVEVYDDKFNAVVASAGITGLSWTPSNALQRGVTYSWQVKAYKDGREFISPRPPAPQARFRILEKTKADELEMARRDYPSFHLTLGLLYADAGLLDQAAEEFRLVQQSNPDSAIPTRLIEDLKTIR